MPSLDSTLKESKAAGVCSVLVPKYKTEDDTNSISHPVARILKQQIEKEAEHVTKVVGSPPVVRDPLLKWKRHY